MNLVKEWNEKFRNQADKERKDVLKKFNESTKIACDKLVFDDEENVKVVTFKLLDDSYLKNTFKLRKYINKYIDFNTCYCALNIIKAEIEGDEIKVYIDDEIGFYTPSYGISFIK